MMLYCSVNPDPYSSQLSITITKSWKQSASSSVSGFLLYDWLEPLIWSCDTAQQNKPLTQWARKQRGDMNYIVPFKDLPSQRPRDIPWRLFFSKIPPVPPKSLPGDQAFITWAFGEAFKIQDGAALELIPYIDIWTVCCYFLGFSQ